jgi:hypothetical protein
VRLVNGGKFHAGVHDLNEDEGVVSLYYQPQTFGDPTLPLGLDTLKLRRTFDTRALATTFPFDSAEIENRGGALVGRNVHSGSLVFYDRFGLENYNQVVLACSGAGKSYLAKLLVLRSLFEGAEVLVIDLESEYERLAPAVGGTVAQPEGFEGRTGPEAVASPSGCHAGKGRRGGEEIVLKLAELRPPDADTTLERAKREVSLPKETAHPNIVRVLSDLTEVRSNGFHEVVWLEEYPDGEDLWARLNVPWSWDIHLSPTRTSSVPNETVLHTLRDRAPHRIDLLQHTQGDWVRYRQLHDPGRALRLPLPQPGDSLQSAPPRRSATSQCASSSSGNLYARLQRRPLLMTLKAMGVVLESAKSQHAERICLALDVNGWHLQIGSEQG